MKKSILRAAILAAVVLTTQACDSDFDPTADMEEIPVVYGMLNQQDTAHYIRIERAFLDKKTSALTLAKDPDQIYFKNLSAVLEEVSSTGTVVNRFPLAKVNGTLEGYPRDSGVFSNDPNFLYKTKATLKPSTTYRLVLNTNESTRTYTATTQTLEPFTISSPIAGNDLYFRTGNKFSVNCNLSNTVKTNAGIFDIKAVVVIDERPLGGAYTRNTYDWVIARNVSPNTQNNNVRVELDGGAFFKNLKSVLPKTANLERCSNSVRVRFVVTAGGSEFAEYVKSINVASGIASTDVAPKYTNLENGRGVLSSKYVLQPLNEYKLNDLTIDSLSYGFDTRGLGFRTFNGQGCQ